MTNHNFERKPCKVIRLSQRQQHTLSIAESNKEARAMYERKLRRDERFARESGMRAAAEYLHKRDVEKAVRESWWLKLTSAISLAVFLWLWTMWT